MPRSGHASSEADKTPRLVSPWFAASHALVLARKHASVVLGSTTGISSLKSYSTLPPKRCWGQLSWHLGHFG